MSKEERVQWPAGLLGYINYKYCYKDIRQVLKCFNNCLYSVWYSAGFAQIDITLTSIPVEEDIHKVNNIPRL